MPYRSLIHLWTLVPALAACNIEALTQEFYDQHTRDSDSSSSSGTSSPAADTGSTSTGGAGSSGTQGPDSGPLETTSTGGPMGTSSGSSGAASTSGEPAAVCGDGVVEGDEECDDPGDTRCFECVRDRLVFVTSEDVQGDFWTWSPQNLDYWCNHLAAVAGLITDNKFRFKTWISTSEESAAERIFHSRGRYVLRNGLVFAESWDALMAQQILNPLNVDENSQTRNTAVFTDTRPDGTAMPGSHCDDWQSDSFDTLVYWGLSAATDASWTLYVGDATNPVSCDIASALYCFESP